MKVEPIDGISTFISSKDALSVAASAKESSANQPPMSGDTKKEIFRIVEKMQTYLESMNISVNFRTYGEKNERIAILVVERETGKVIREIPPEELQRLYQRMCELSGLLYNGKI